MPELLQELFEALVNEDPADLAAYLRPLAVDVPVASTEAKVHGYMVRIGPTGKARIKDLARVLALRITNFAIPRSDIKRARELDAKKGNQAATNGLFLKARELFVQIETTGEPGDILLYVLAQAQLKMPQLFCKMTHKTNTEVHYHGADGIHGRLTADGGGNDILAICFAQSKLKASENAAIKECLDDVKPFLCEEGGSSSPQKRDLELMRDFIDLDSPDLEAAVLNYLNPDHSDYLKLKYRGLCLAGFDGDEYPESSTADEQGTHATLSERMSDWTANLAKWIAERAPLDGAPIDVFLVPVPSVQTLRDAFLNELGHGA